MPRASRFNRALKKAGNRLLARAAQKCTGRVGFKLAAAVCLLALLSACNESHEVLSQAYVAPQNLHLRSDLSTKGSTVADLKHGAQVSIVDVQRRMVKVRTVNGLEGWVDSLDLLSADQMNQLKKTREQEALLPSQGSATAFEILNVHIDPSRSSPAFAQIAEGASLTVLGHRATPKVSAPNRSPAFTVQHPLSQRKQRKEQKDRSNFFRLPPKPAPPRPPANWQQLSAERITASEAPPPTVQNQGKAAAAKLAAAKPVVMEDWTLVRTKANEIGWVLTRNLLFSIPDEVAQYAEGKHIIAFFDLGAVNDEVKGQKHNWLWATAASGLPYDFDSWRVFLWNTHHHRYETSFRQRDLEGYFPIHVDAPEAGSLLRSFQIITKDADGKSRRRSYTFDGTLVHISGVEEYDPGKAKADGSANAIDTRQLQSKMPHPGWFRRQWTALRQSLSGM